MKHQKRLLLFIKINGPQLFCSSCNYTSDVPHFKKHNKGNMTVISSIAGLIGFPLRSGYSASKHAIKGI
jgi:short-subunit dehydrogenase